MEGTLHSKRYRTANKDEDLPVTSPGGLVQSGGYQVAMGTNPKTAEENKDKVKGPTGEPVLDQNKGPAMDKLLDELNPNRKKKDGK